MASAASIATSMEERRRALDRFNDKVKELSEYVKPRNNVHGKIKKLVADIYASLNRVMQEENLIGIASSMTSK